MSLPKQRTKSRTTASLIEAKTAYAIKAMEFRRGLLERERVEREEKKRADKKKVLDK